MQPPNLSLDPAASLWSNNSPSNNLFTQSPDAAGDGSFGLGGPTFFPQNMAGIMNVSGSSDLKSDQMPDLTANSASPARNDNSAGEVFVSL